MSTTPLKIDILEDGVRPREWRSRKSNYKIPLRLLRLCVLGMFLPAVLVAGPLYLRYRVYSDQLYPFAVSDQRLIDARVSTTWCQSQIIRVNATFNAYLMSNEPVVEKEAMPVSMTRHLIMEDDMKEYWGFYLLRGSSVTVSTCVRWPGASLTIIRGHKNLHECAFIGDDSSEELEELLEIAEEKGLLNIKGTEAERPSNVPEKMRRAGQNVHFHHEGNVSRLNTSELPGHHLNSLELDAQAMRNILAQLSVKTQSTKKKQRENPHHHYEPVFRDSDNIDKPPVTNYTESLQNLLHEKSISNLDNKETSKSNIKSTLSPLNVFSEKESSSEIKQHTEEEQKMFDVQIETTTKSEIVEEDTKANQADSAEVFQDVLRKINSLGERGRQMLRKLMDEIDAKNDAKGVVLKRLVTETMNDKTLSEEDKRRRRRDLVLSSPLHRELTEDDEDADAAIEEGMLHPDGIAEDRGTVNETSLNDRSNSELWSSFSSSEERLLECKGLILNLPLTPHRHCAPERENDHSAASFANTVTYRVPLNGYYFFVFNSENEVQTNYVRVKFDLLKTVYDISNPVYTCKNSTKECSLPFKIFSSEKTILELPVSGNDSQWNEEYVVISTCEPRTSIYMFCIIMVPVLILFFAFN